MMRMLVDYLPLPPLNIYLPSVENLLPSAKVQFTNRHCHVYYTAYDLAFDMSVSIVFAGAVMKILACQLMWGKKFQPFFIILL